MVYIFFDKIQKMIGPNPRKGLREVPPFQSKKIIQKNWLDPVWVMVLVRVRVKIRLGSRSGFGFGLGLG